MHGRRYREPAGTVPPGAVATHARGDGVLVLCPARTPATPSQLCSTALTRGGCPPHAVREVHLAREADAPSVAVPSERNPAVPGRGKGRISPVRIFISAAYYYHCCPREAAAYPTPDSPLWRPAAATRKRLTPPPRGSASLASLALHAARRRAFPALPASRARSTHPGVTSTSPPEQPTPRLKHAAARTMSWLSFPAPASPPAGGRGRPTGGPRL